MLPFPPVIPVIPVLDGTAMAAIESLVLETRYQLWVSCQLPSCHPLGELN